jgi:proton-translocating NADH-quinone oxidoreductase chain L
VTEFFVHNAWLVPLLPLAGGLTAAVGGRWLKGNSHIPVVIGIGLAFLASLALLAGSGGHAQPTPIEWIEVSGLTVPFQFRVDGLTTMMVSMVTFVATLVAIFAAGYMAGDPGYPRFFAVVGLFVASMTGLVLSSNFILTYAFWEGVGTCSYLLIGFWHTKPSAAAAAKKAFLVNRIGDVGFAIAIFWLWTVCLNHDVSYDNVFSVANLSQIPHHAVVGIGFLLFWAATAKSAQVPLYVWLPDAMEGPTPVSALIHAATMVTAGVYLIARSTPLIVLAPEVQATVAVVGCVTALLAALIALTQNDLKRVMAYSTVSQLGYMFMGLGAGVGDLAAFAVIAGMFHLFTHAFFKALLFLASGSVMHSMGGVIDMRRFGGLRKRMPITCITFGLGALALMGIPPFAGFFSKDEILSSLHLASIETEKLGGAYPTLYVLVYWTAILTAALTAFYTGRAFFMTFFGPERLPSPTDPEAEPSDDSHAHGHGDGHDSHFGHEAPPIMWIPLAVLAVCAVVVGALFGLTGWFAHHLEHTPGLAEAEGTHHAFDWFTAIVSTSGALIALGVSYLFYGLRSNIPARLATSLKPLYLASLNKFYVDEIYERVVVWPTKILAEAAQFFDIVVVHNLVRLAGWLPGVFGRYVLGPFQNGLIQYYAAVTALSVAGLLFVFLWLSVS